MGWWQGEFLEEGGATSGRDDLGHVFGASVQSAPNVYCAAIRRAICIRCGSDSKYLQEVSLKNSGGTEQSD